MERKHMSALSIYQSLSGGTKPQVQAKSPPAKKTKRKENGIQPNKKPNKKKRMRALKSSMRLSSSEKEKSKAEKDCETHNGEGFESPALDALLTDLTKVNNSRDRANRLFQWLLHPVQDKSFFRDNWEKKPILIQRQNPDYYKGLFSTAEFDHILRNEDVQYAVNLDVTSYTNGKRETHNPPGRALPYTVWDFYESGCSLRMLNPQAFSSSVWQVLSILQEKFGSMVGANVYLTPAGTQGFAPHYDDIEAFILQLEGKKHWRVYNPRPHILMPLDYLQFMGVQNSEKEDPRRDKFIAHVEGLMKKLVSFAPADAAVDQKARDFLHDCLPPVLSAEEKASSVYGAPARWGDGEALDVTVQLKGQTQIRLVRAGAARLCGDGETVSLFYTTENSRVYRKEEPKSIEMKAEHIDAMEFLIHSYPKFVSVASLPCEKMEAKMSLAELLFEKGLIHTAEPLTAE
ncbi:bifunctional lysine-specific demethylase and histidyl-hydroxylase NO66-like [Sinocyclocheilus grahami]|uniref:bifunctional lysine-specific demethylase and histidyl-hydroxylase NO66-like n=1 Tax=Sinocyclocheilus grahami TaxID=75366 RepID=UPI0007AC6208|nr:PREDICTED: bifunctional lysine-specific demethylase and histidyl-hydroxylase NO66-like [Sinocyclocheilus grahami]